MSEAIRARTLQALRAAAQFDIPPESLARVMAATPDLLSRPERVAEIEGHIRAIRLEGVTIPVHARWATLPALGNMAEAFVESMLVDFGWQPLYDDDSGYSAGHGVDLLMLDPSLSPVVAIEVKSTIQRGRWPRRPPESRAQMTPAWLGRASNEGMREWTFDADDVHSMIVQAHLGRLKWRVCVAGDLDSPLPVASVDQLVDLSWLIERN
ncbi:hypothetical protein [Pseudoclavibacter sp. 8L]|uniref:hypothetical protein n=1 Tax=Pseudoclavibacter sp. 8L TaxID=2653162 RepID=UPI0012EFC704|nr:hypothetical protein [Pseudoclavibacter sp. 8L]VXB71173.1 conserved hypothetical protein [Pseudoclavibacter sp. 8L]